MSQDKYDERTEFRVNRASAQPTSGTTRFIGWWTAAMQRYAPLVMVTVIAATAGVLFYSVKNFRINTDFNSMISEKLHFRKIEKDFDKSFPQLSDTIVIILDANTPEQAMSARKRFASQLRNEKDSSEMFTNREGGSILRETVCFTWASMSWNNSPTSLPGPSRSSHSCQKTSACGGFSLCSGWP